MSKNGGEKSEEEKKATFLEHLEELRTRLIRIFIVVGGLTVFFFMFGIRKTNFSNHVIYYPYPAIFESISAKVLSKLQRDLLPEGVRLIQTTPAEAITALLYTSLFLGILFGMPIIVYEIGKFVAPGLYPHEKKAIARMIIPSTILFVTGCFFSYYLLIPFMIYFLYRYGFAMGIVTFLTIESFISFILTFLVAFGVAFQLPIIMVTLSSLGIVEPKFWRENLRIAIFALFVFGAAITPDGSGVTMTIVALPLISLYIVGWLASEKGITILPKPKQEKIIS